MPADASAMTPLEAMETSSAADSSEESHDEGGKDEGGFSKFKRKVKNSSAGIEILCGLTVAMALVPEALGCALAAGLTPSIGLHSAWIIALFTALLGGRPAMISAATGSLSVLVGEIVIDKGVEYMFVAVVVMGIIEIILGLAGIGKLLKLIPSPVMIGFCNGLACVIGLAQFSNFKEVSNPEGAIQTTEGDEQVRRLGNFDAFTNGRPWLSGTSLMWAVIITAVSFLVCTFLPRLSKKVPSALVAIIIGTAIEWALARKTFSSHTPTVDDVAGLRGSLPSIAWLDKEYKMPPLNLETFRTVLPLSITMASVGLLESLMTLNLIDELTDTTGNPMRECIGQGVANIACGVLGGMGGCAMVGQSMINIGSGGRSRLSSATSGLVLLLIVMVAYPLINVIPVSALVGVMFNVVFQTFEWKSVKLMLMPLLPMTLRERFFSEVRSKQKIRRADALVMVAVTVVTLLTDLAVAVGTGMALSCAFFVWDTASMISVSTRFGQDPSGSSIKYYDVHGVLFFGSCTQFLSLFDEKHDPEDVRLVFESGYVADFSAIEALNKLGERYGAYGKRVTMQQLKPSCSRLVEKAAGLLVKELNVLVEKEEVLSKEREHLHVENWVEDHDHGMGTEEEDSDVDDSALPMWGQRSNRE